MDKKKNSKPKKITVPLCDKFLLTIPEAAKYTGIGVNRLRRLANKRNSKLIIWVGARKMFKRELLDEYLENTNTI